MKELPQSRLDTVKYMTVRDIVRFGKLGHRIGACKEHRMHLGTWIGSGVDDEASDMKVLEVIVSFSLILRQHIEIRQSHDQAHHIDELLLAPPYTTEG